MMAYSAFSSSSWVVGAGIENNLNLFVEKEINLMLLSKSYSGQQSCQRGFIELLKQTLRTKVLCAVILNNELDFRPLKRTPTIPFQTPRPAAG